MLLSRWRGILNWIWIWRTGLHLRVRSLVTVEDSSRRMYVQLVWENVGSERDVAERAAAERAAVAVAPVLAVVPLRWRDRWVCHLKCLCP